MLRRLGPVLAVLLLVLATAASASEGRSVPRGWLGRSASALSSLCAQHARRYFDAIALHPYKKRASDLREAMRLEGRR